MSEWSVVYEKAIRDDGSLLFPERLTQEFLDSARRTMGSYLFANQYQNEIIPDGEQTFIKDWIRYYTELPDRLNTFIFIDPAISTADTADFTGISVVSTDVRQNWWVRYATRMRCNPSELIDMLFQLNHQFKPLIIGIEDVAFQRAIIHFAFEEMKRRNNHIPLTGVKIGTDKSKETRILSLVPRFEFGTVFLSPSCQDLELELAQFPRGTHDDVLDSLASMQEIVYYPNTLRSKNEQPHPSDPAYESWYINNLHKRGRNTEY